MKRMNIERNTFDEKLLSEAIKDPYKVQLSSGSGQHGQGIIYGRGECHTVIIKDRKTAINQQKKKPS